MWLCDTGNSLASVVHYSVGAKQICMLPLIRQTHVSIVVIT